MIRIILVALIYSELASLVATCCQNGCSGHGICTPGTCSCDCFSHFTGGDCSLRKCPMGHQWVGDAEATDSIHEAMAECSNVGTCDTSSGTCSCQNGFTGIACERMKCPNDCSGHGRCLSLKDAARMRDDVSYFRETQYEMWDAERIFGCFCDFGYSGRDCSARICERGDDPVTTTNTDDEVQVIECTCPNTCSGNVFLTFENEITESIPFDASASVVQAKIENLRTINGVTISMTGGTSLCDADGASTSITFTHNSGNLPEFIINSGTLATTTGSVEIKLLHSGQTSTQGATTQSGTKERLQCNGRGKCGDDGLCTCLTGLSGSNGAGATGFLNDCGYIDGSITSCPSANVNDCSGKGTCSGSPNYLCTCYEGYQGIDCSERICPKHKAWFSEPGKSLPGFVSVNNNANFLTSTEDLRLYLDRGDSIVFGNPGIGNKVTFVVSSLTSDTFDASTVPLSTTYTGSNLAFVEIYKSPNHAHFNHEIECSGKGTCDRSTGTCSCDSGFTGRACQRIQCPNDCNGRGRCMSLSQMAEKTRVNGELVGYTYGATFEKKETFDKDMVFGCSCDKSLWVGGFYDFSGNSCSQRVCVTGEDPSAAETSVNEVQKVTCIGTGGSFKLSFRDHESAEILFSATASEVDSALEAIKTVGEVTVSFNTGAQACGASPGTEITITFLTDLGNLPSLGKEDSSLTGTSAAVTVAETVAGTRVALECSNHGLCNRQTGVCSCFKGYVSSDGKGQRGGRGDCSFRDALYKG